MSDHVETLEELRKNSERWLRVSYFEKKEILKEILDNYKIWSDTLVSASLNKRYYKNGPSIQEAACQIQVTSSSSLMSAIWLSTLVETYDYLSLHNEFPPPAAVTPNPDGSSKISVASPGALVSMILGFGSLELHAADASQISPSEKRAGVSFIFGAGNYECCADIMTTLFVDQNVAFYKWSPMSVEISKKMEEVFDPLVKRGYLRFAHISDNQLASTLSENPLIDKVCLTGSRTTANRLLWGEDEVPEHIKNNSHLSQVQNPSHFLKDKTLCFELGCCTAWLIAPSKWSWTEITRHAKLVAAAILSNGGHICASIQLVVTSSNWPQREHFLTQLRTELAAAPVVGCFYPNYYENIQDAKAKLKAEGQTEEDISIELSYPICNLPDQPNCREIIFAHGLKPDTFLATQEVFGPICGEVPLDTPNSAAGFLLVAVPYLNDRTTGNLSTSISIKPKTSEDEKELENAICNLKYSGVTVNSAPPNPILFPQLIWGGYSGTGSPSNPNSGWGHIGNAHGYKTPLKAVVRQPFINLAQFCHIMPNSSNVGRQQKTISRTLDAFLQKSDSRFKTVWHLTAITSALVFNL